MELVQACILHNSRPDIDGSKLDKGMWLARKARDREGSTEGRHFLIEVKDDLLG